MVNWSWGGGKEGGCWVSCCWEGKGLGMTVSAELTTGPVVWPGLWRPGWLWILDYGRWLLLVVIGTGVYSLPKGLKSKPII